MGTSSYVLAGTHKSESLAFASACHGAGRAMSLHKALKHWHGRQVVDDLAARGIIVQSTSSRGIAEEAPPARTRTSPPWSTRPMKRGWRASRPLAAADLRKGIRGQALEKITLLLAGDVMLGRGIDQVMPEPLPPVLYEPWVHGAREYVRLAEKATGAIPAPVDMAYVWGDALAEMSMRASAATLHGCGDLVNDYEGIKPHGRQRSDLGCLYGVTLDRSNGRLVRLEIVNLETAVTRGGSHGPARASTTA